MTLDTSILKTDLENVCGDLPSVLMFKGAEIIGMSGTVSKEGDTGMVGLGQMSDIEFSSTAARFITTPKPKDTATLDGKTHIIDRVQLSADGVQVQLFMSRPKAGISL